MNYMITGKHFIAGQWLDGERTFRSDPYRGIGREYAEGTAADIDLAAKEAERAFSSFSHTSTAERCNLLNAIANRIEQNRSQIIQLCMEETGLIESRITGEFARTVNQLRYFASFIVDNEHADNRHDPAMLDRTPLPRPDFRMMHRPVGPVAVFGASNFPLAFSTAGGDTAAALAAGCPVVVKGHSAHPGTAELVAQCIGEAIRETGRHAGVFSQVQSNSFEAGQALVQHPVIKAVGFTGSLGGGRYLYNLCAAREEPIPFFGELGSINPVFMLPQSLAENTQKLATDWITSLTFGAGQLCTNPGLLVLVQSEAAEAFIASAREEVRTVGQQAMLTDSIAQAYKEGHDRLSQCAGVFEVQRADCSRRTVTPSIYKTTGKTWLENEFLSEEIFGPIGQVVLVESIEELYQVANALHGQLTCTIHMEERDNEIAKRLLSIAEVKAGRVIVNGFPTGVEVADSMVHGGPYPASTNFGATSVGSLSIRRFLRPVCYQNVPESLLSGR